ncbi:MAG: YicC family protein [Nitrospira sp.]|nr:YicC family protein [Nitrospira sp.]
MLTLMIQSMTGFGSASNNEFTVEIRSLNHRYIDISIKLPPYMNQYEIPLRNILKGRFQRGRFDVSITTNINKVTQLIINKELSRNICAALQDLQRELSLPGTIDIETLTGFREIIVEEKPQYDIDTLFTAFHEAVSNLESMRIREGNLLAGEILGRIELLRELNNKINLLAPDELIKWRKKFTERLRLIVEDGMIDNNRIVQEAALMAEKLDISEEISRIESHVKQFIEILNNSNIIGKKLDFLLQEINREVNTIANKSSDYAISSLTVEMKTEIEKMREQAQNIQ